MEPVIILITSSLLNNIHRNPIKHCLSFSDSEMTGVGEYGLTGQGSSVGGVFWSFTLKESRVQRGQVARSGGPCGVDVEP